jgi:hypothetical protein
MAWPVFSLRLAVVIIARESFTGWNTTATARAWPRQSHEDRTTPFQFRENLLCFLLLFFAIGNVFAESRHAPGGRATLLRELRLICRGARRTFNPSDATGPATRRRSPPRRASSSQALRILTACRRFERYTCAMPRPPHPFRLGRNRS